MPKKETVCLLWVRNDLRVEDQQALFDAGQSGLPVMPLFIWSPERGSSTPGAVSRWWLHHSLFSLASQLAGLSSRLIVKLGDPLKIFEQLCRDYDVSAVFTGTSYEPAQRAEDQKIAAYLRSKKIRWEPRNTSLLLDVFSIKNQQGLPYQVFTPFYRRVLEEKVSLPLGKIKKLKPLSLWPDSASLESLKLLPSIPWDQEIKITWRPGPDAAQKNLKLFLLENLSSYDMNRDIPGEKGTSRLSPYLHFGEISPRWIWSKLNSCKDSADSETFRKELIWREFAHHLMVHFPHTIREPLRPQFKKFPWKENAGYLRAWQKGSTGIPIIDAGMRELWRTGWMHNRVRMIVASFLVKNMQISWIKGADWFWDTLVDADLANNTFNWQWAAGCGADAAPYFRIFNPVLQGQKFDTDGVYVKKYVPELQRLPSKWIHHPWDAPSDVLKKAGVVLGETYPKPLVSIELSRRRALEAYHSFQAK